MIKLVIFDFDGTLADTHQLIIRTNQEAMRRMNYPVADEKTITSIIGIPLEDGLLSVYPDIPRQTLPVWVETYRQVFESLRREIVPALFPQVPETLAALHGRGYVLTVASSRHSSSLNAFLQEMGLAQWFSLVLGADNVTRAKPHPDPVLHTLRQTGFRPEETLVVGDMPVDIRMGLGAGAFTCGVTFGNSDRASLAAAGAHHILDHFAPLLPLLP